MNIWERQRRLSQGTSARIVELLRREPLTIDEIAGAVGLTRTAVRAQLATLQREGIVEERGLQRGPSKPARTYGVQAEAELLLSRAYIPILTQLLHVLADQMSRDEFDAVMREVGRGLMKGRAMPQGTIRERVAAASVLLNACNALESLLSEFVGQSVNKCCDQYARQRCCFEVSLR